MLNNNSATAGGITISGPGSVSIAQLTNSGTGGGSALVSAVITDAGVVQNSSASSLLLSGANTYSEGTTVTSGTLLIGISSATSGSGGNSSITSGATGTGPVTVNGGVLDVSTFNLAVGGLNGSGGTVASSSTSIAGSLTIVTSSTAPSSSYSGIIADTTGAGSKTVSVVVGGNGFGTTAGGQTLAGANTYSGGTTITGGDLVVGVSSVTTGSGAALSITSGATGTGLLTINGGFLDLSTFNLTVAGLSGSGGTITTSSTGTPGSLTIVTGATPETYSGSIVQGRINGSKTVSLTVVGTGLQTLAGTNIYSGGTIVIGGALALSGAGTLGTGPLQVSNLNTGAGTAVVLNLSTTSSLTTGSLSGTIAAPSSGTNTATINTQTGETFTINQITPGTFAGVIAGGGNFALEGNSNAALTLSGANTYTGPTIISAGILSTGTSGTLADADTASSIGDPPTGVASGLFLSGGTLQYASMGAAETTNRLFTLTAPSALDASGTNPITFSNTGAIALAQEDLTLTLTGSGSGVFDPIIPDFQGTSLIKTGSGRWALSGEHLRRRHDDALGRCL